MWDEYKYDEGVRFLAQGGLNVLSVASTKNFPPGLMAMFKKERVLLERFSRLVVVAHGGRQLWAALRAKGMESDDPVDLYSSRLIEEFQHNCLNHAEVYRLYPSSRVFPIQQLARFARMTHQSLMGVDIHGKYGMWIGYRSLFLTDAPLPITRPDSSVVPCDACDEKQCISSCAGTAVRAAEPFNLQQCANYRLQADSACAYGCLSRNACPVGNEYRYVPEQMRYHFARSLRSLKRYTVLKAAPTPAL